MNSVTSANAQKIVPERPPKGHFFFAGRTFPRVKWWKNGRLRKLYLYVYSGTLKLSAADNPNSYIVILVLTNTANGFDGSMMNGN